MKTITIPAEKLFEDTSVNVRLDVAELHKEVRVSPIGNRALGVLLMNESIAGVFQNPVMARVFGMQLETSRELGLLRDAAVAVITCATQAEILAALQKLAERVKQTDELLVRAAAISAGEVPGR